MSLPLGTGPSNALDSTYGAMLIGVLVAMFLQGILTLQTYNYFEGYPKDPLRTKITVAVVWCLDTVQLALTCHAVYHYLVTNWGFFPALEFSTFQLDVSLAFIALSSFICQIFFVHRIWIFSKNVFIVAVLLALCLPVLAFELVKTVQIMSNLSVASIGDHQYEITVIFLVGAIADVAIAACLCFYLRSNQSGFTRTNSLVARVIRYTLASGLATSALGIASLVAYFAAKTSFYFIAIHFSLGRMYTNSLLATLNARRKMQADINSALTSTQSRSRTVDTRYINPFPSPGIPEQREMQYPYTVETAAYKDIEMGKVPGLPGASSFIS